MVEAVFLCVYTILQPYLLKIDSRKVKLLFGSKWPFWESNLLCVYTLLLPHLLNFDSRKAAFWLEMAVLGIKPSMCIHSPSTIIPLEI